MNSILLFEDQSIIAMDLKRFLSRNGINVYGPLTSFNNFFNSVDSFKPDILLLDLSLGWNNTDEELSSLFKLCRLVGTPAIFLSTNINHHKKLASDYSRFYFLDIPYEHSSLLEAIKNCVPQNHYHSDYTSSYNTSY